MSSGAVLLSVSGLSSVYEAEQTARLFLDDLIPKFEFQRPQPGDLLVPAGRWNGEVRCRVLVAVRASSRRAAAAWRDAEGTRVLQRRLSAGENSEQACCRLLFDLLCSITGKRPPWGFLTGVRPVHVVRRLLCGGKTGEQTVQFLSDVYEVTAPKAELAVRTADAQKAIIASMPPRGCSLYVSIPFCPSRCAYCSFVALGIESQRDLVQPYLDLLCREIEETCDQIRSLGFSLCAVYVGGGTPTSLSADQLRRLLGCIRSAAQISALQEFTVEAGRPDCTDAEKLAVMKDNGVTRISVNPQTFSDDVLTAIGRRHTVREFLDCYEAARSAGHRNINMDLIAGLPGDTPDGFGESLARAAALRPESITVHALTLKRASGLVIGRAPAVYPDAASCLAKTELLGRAGYRPYYLYRQKGTLQNMENTGYSLPGFECLYNIYMMEELQPVFSAGAGACTRLVDTAGGRVRRIFNYKYPREYIEHFSDVLQRKERIGEFYASHLDTETAR